MRSVDSREQALNDAEIVRALQPLTAEFGSPAPSYFAVRRIAGSVRLSDTSMNPYLDELVTKLAQGRMPNFYYVDSLLATQAAFERRVEAEEQLSPGRSTQRGSTQ